VGPTLRERAKFFCRRNVYNRIIGLRPRSDEPYSTHLPILCALGASVQPKRIVEYGSGLNSTPAFLDRSLFPRLESLLSFENSRSWYEAVAESTRNDARMQLRLVEGAMKHAVAINDLEGCSLVFVDDSDEFGRADTIKAIAACRPVEVPIVIHDLELKHILDGAKRFEHMFRFDALSPQTGVAWNGSWDVAKSLPRMNRLIKQLRGKVASSDAEQWGRFFGSSMRLRAS
jgi:hypothetical protein